MTIIVSFKALLLWLLFGTIKDEVVYIVHTRISLGPYFGLKIAKKCQSIYILLKQLLTNIYPFKM